jgi:hypothetical protein
MTAGATVKIFGDVSRKENLLKLSRNAFYYKHDYSTIKETNAAFSSECCRLKS